MADILYHNFFAEIMKGTIDADNGGDVFNMQLHTSTHTPSIDDAVKADLDNEVANGNGYTTGGYAFTNTNLAITDDDSNDLGKFDIAEDAVWSSSTITARYGILLDNTHASDALVGCFDFTEDKSTTNGTFTLQFNASGVLTIA